MRTIKFFAQFLHGILSGITTGILLMAVHRGNYEYPWGFIIFFLAPVLTALVLDSMKQYIAFYPMGFSCALTVIAVRYINNTETTGAEILVLILAIQAVYMYLGFLALRLKEVDESE